MRDERRSAIWARLYKNRVALAILASALAWLVAIILIALGREHSLTLRGFLLQVWNLGLDSLASALVGLFTIGIVYEFFVRRESSRELEAQMSERDDVVVQAVKTEVHNALLAEPRFLASLDDESVGRVLEACLAARVSDGLMAQELCEGPIRMMTDFEPERRWYDFSGKAILIERTEDKWSELYEVRLSISFDKVISEKQFEVVGVADRETYESYDSAPGVLWAHWVSPGVLDHLPLDEAFRVHSVRVDRRPLDCDQGQNDSRNFVTRWTGDALSGAYGRRASVEVEFSVPVRRADHRFYLDFTLPVKGVYVELDYARAPSVSSAVAYAFMLSSKDAGVRKLPEEKPHRIEVATERQWTFPKSGVVFVW